MRQRGFSVLELAVVVTILVVVSGGVFALLNETQDRYRMESEVVSSFQSARLGMDQISRDVHSAGYPPVSWLPCALAKANPQNVAYPFAWAPGYVDPTCPPPSPMAGCTMGVACTTPGPYDLIIEADIDPQNNNGVEWIRYSLVGTTLFRGVASKVAGGDPVATTKPALLPYVENVVNNPGKALINQLTPYYPNLFPGGNPVPIFSYSLSSVAGTQVPQKIREVSITLIAMAPELDPQTGQPRVVTLTGLARRVDPN